VRKRDRNSRKYCFIVFKKIIIPRWKVRKYDFKKCRPKRRRLKIIWKVRKMKRE